jgi:glycosyltransferase involved in cell wall biosynthesis
MTPLLSICIPTFNRAHYLENMLQCLVRECATVGDQVEIVISDNCSDDDTAALVERFRGKLRIRYHRNARNIGPAANVVFVPSLASGTYCWMFGDDDLLVPGALREVLGLLRESPETLAIVVGYSYQQECNRAQYTAEDAPISFERPVFQCDPEPKWVPRWEDTFFATASPALHTSIVSCVFNRHHWMQHAPDVAALSSVDALTSLESTFPHTLTWAAFLVGKPVVFAPKPFVYFFVGAQEWFKPKWATIMFSFGLELAQHFRELGGDDGAVRYYESLILMHGSLASLIAHPSEFAKRYFSLAVLLRRYGGRNELWNNLLRSAQTEDRGSRARVLRRISGGCVRAPQAALPCARFFTELVLGYLRRLVPRR